MKKASSAMMISLLILASCGGNNMKQSGESMSTGESQIFVEDAFRPIIDEQLNVFLALNPKAKLSAKYSDENSLVNDLLATGNKAIIISRTLNPQEIKNLKSKSFTPEINQFAVDAIALIVNNSVKDTAIGVDRLKALLTGKNKSKNVVFDNPNSGTVRFLKSLSGSDLKSSNIYALKSNLEVIKYVNGHSDCIGVIDFNWLSASDNESAKDRQVRLLAVGKDSRSGYFKPSQTTLALKQYPLTTGIYIINATGKLGLGAGFANFLIGERGQRIILKSELLPTQMPTREISIKN